MLSTLYDARNPKRRRVEGGFAPPPVRQYLWNRLASATLFRASLAALLLLAQPAAAARSDWSRQSQSELRLLLVPGSGPTLRGGVDIVLEPGWHTYWRNPGDTGVPPAFDFSRSVNVKAIEVHYPTPRRHQDDTGVSLIYDDEVVFPLSVVPERPEMPVTLRLHGSFGVCREICLPVAADAEVTLPTAPRPDPLSEALLQRFVALVPGPPTAGILAVESVSVADDALDVAVRMPDSSDADLFVDAPQGWYLGQPTFVSRTDGVSHYRVSLQGRPKEAPVSGQTFRFVAVAGGRAAESEITLGSS
jgi:DsbC/DsbD-like thiol-disulfide interchange protein